jgi:hypothetical protein
MLEHRSSICNENARKILLYEFPFTTSNSAIIVLASRKITVEVKFQLFCRTMYWLSVQLGLFNASPF